MCVYMGSLPTNGDRISLALTQRPPYAGTNVSRCFAHRSPFPLRFCDGRWVDYCQKLHRERLSTMKTTAQYPRLKTLDNRAPETMNMPHLMLRQKKVQKEEERYQEVRSWPKEEGR